MLKTKKLCQTNSESKGKACPKKLLDWIRFRNYNILILNLTEKGFSSALKQRYLNPFIQ